GATRDPDQARCRPLPVLGAREAPEKVLSGSGMEEGAVSAGGGATSSAGRLRDDAFELSTSLAVADSFATSIQPANRGRAPKALVLRSFRGPHLARDLARRLSREVRVL